MFIYVINMDISEAQLLNSFEKLARNICSCFIIFLLTYILYLFSLIVMSSYVIAKICYCRDIFFLLNTQCSLPALTNPHLTHGKPCT